MRIPHNYDLLCLFFVPPSSFPSPLLGVLIVVVSLVVLVSSRLRLLSLSAVTRRPPILSKFCFFMCIRPILSPSVDLLMFLVLVGAALCVYTYMHVGVYVKVYVYMYVYVLRHRCIRVCVGVYTYMHRRRCMYVYRDR